MGDFAEPADTSAWKQLRELRNLTVGHPIEKGGKRQVKRTFVTRVSLRSDGFDYQVWDRATGETSFESADLSTLCVAYETEAISYLRKVITALSSVPDIRH